MKNISIIACACFLCVSFQVAYAQENNPEEIKQSLFSILFEIEQAAGLDHKASGAINNLNDEGKQILYDSIGNKEKYLESVNKALERIQKVKTLDKTQEIESQAIPSPTLGAVKPSYPPTYSAAYNIAHTLLLTQSNQERCDGVGLEIYEDSLYAAEKVANVGDAACSFAGCDPTGIGCAVVCGVVEGYKLAVMVLRIPIDSCNKHNEGVNAAEIEAGYENSVSVLNDLATTLKNQDRLLNNQDRIIKLLLTPQGSRPGWNKDQ